MRVHFSVVGFTERPTWPSAEVDLDVLPREGETVEVPGMPESAIHVRTVVHYPWGDGEDSAPSAYVVLGPPRR